MTESHTRVLAVDPRAINVTAERHQFSPIRPTMTETTSWRTGNPRRSPSTRPPGPFPARYATSCGKHDQHQWPVKGSRAVFVSETRPRPSEGISAPLESLKCLARGGIADLPTFARRQGDCAVPSRSDLRSATDCAACHSNNTVPSTWSIQASKSILCSAMLT